MDETKVLIKKTNYNFSLDLNVLERARKIADDKGYKLSPLVNIWLKKWVEENEGEEE